MSRQLVSVVYTNNNNAQCLNPETSEVIRVFEPETIISIGNSIGGYYCRGSNWKGDPRIELVRLSGREKHLNLREIWDLTKDRQGETIRPGLMLMATSSGAARNGVFHRYTPPTSPLEFALRDRRVSFRIVEKVESIDLQVQRGGNLCSHSTTPGNYRHGYVTDCQEELVKEGERVGHHMNRFHRGCMRSPATYRLHGGTFIVNTFTRKCMNGGDFSEVTKVILTPGADLEIVAQAIRSA